MKKSILILLILLVNSACSQQVIIPKDFYFNDKAIEALCIPETKGQKTDLKHCGSNNAELVINNGSTAYEQKYIPKAEQGSSLTYYSGYKYIGTVAGNHVLLLTNNTGGTGWFTSVPILRLEGDHLIAVDNLAFGDRCNGGINEVYIKEGKIYYYQNVTPYDIVFAHADPASRNKLAADLESSAASCYAQIHMEGNQELGLRINSETIAMLKNQTKDYTDNHAMQVFDTELLKAIKEAKGSYLTIEQHKKLVEDYSKNFLNQMHPVGNQATTHVRISGAA